MSSRVGLCIRTSEAGSLLDALSVVAVAACRVRSRIVDSEAARALPFHHVSRRIGVRPPSSFVCRGNHHARDLVLDGPKAHRARPQD